jgi:hypothetical protein
MNLCILELLILVQTFCYNFRGIQRHGYLI